MESKCYIRNLTNSLIIVEYWRNRHQRMNWERFMAANTMAIVTHTLVSSLILLTYLLFRPNLLIWLRLEHNLYKKVNYIQVSDLLVDGTVLTFSMKFTKLEVVLGKCLLLGMVS
jgi:hypothetical protein